MKLRPRWRRRLGRRIAPWLFLGPALIVLAAFSYFPLVKSVAMSFQSWNLLGTPQYVGADNYRYLFGSTEFRGSLGITVVFTVLTLVATYLLSFGAAMALRRPFAGVKFLRTSMLIPTVIPLVVAGLTWRWILEPRTGVLDQVLATLGLVQPNWLYDPKLALCSVVLVSVWRDFGTYMLVLLGGLLQIDPAIQEAADLDGAHGWQRLRRVTLPLISAANAFVVVMILFNSIKAFDQIWVMTEGGPGTATTTILTYIFGRISAGDMGVAAAASAVLFGIILVLIAARSALENRKASRS